MVIVSTIFSLHRESKSPSTGGPLPWVVRIDRQYRSQHLRVQVRPKFTRSLTRSSESESLSNSPLQNVPEVFGEYGRSHFSCRNNYFRTPFIRSVHTYKEREPPNVPSGPEDHVTNIVSGDPDGETVSDTVMKHLTIKSWRSYGVI